MMLLERHLVGSSILGGFTASLILGLLVNLNEFVMQVFRTDKFYTLKEALFATLLYVPHNLLGLLITSVSLGYFLSMLYLSSQSEIIVAIASGYSPLRLILWSMAFIGVLSFLVMLFQETLEEPLFKFAEAYSKAAQSKDPNPFLSASLASKLQLKGKRNTIFSQEKGVVNYFQNVSNNGAMDLWVSFSPFHLERGIILARGVKRVAPDTYLAISREKILPASRKGLPRKESLPLVFEGDLPQSIAPTFKSLLDAFSKLAPQSFSWWRFMLSKLLMSLESPLILFSLIGLCFGSQRSMSFFTKVLFGVLILTQFSLLQILIHRLHSAFSFPVEPVSFGFLLLCFLFGLWVFRKQETSIFSIFKRR